MAARLLYAEDEESARYIVSNQLLQEGFSVTAVEDGEAAIDQLKTGTFDLVLLDIRMPRKDGLEVLRYMRANGIGSRVIMLTAVDEMSIAISAVKLGANDYLTKPYSLETLLSSIHKVLQR
jgi:DNA-binding response OmpR family regulator